VGIKTNNSPLIGITTFRSKDPRGNTRFSISEAYVSSLVQAGASPIMIPLGLPGPVLDTIISQLDGLVLSGGGDIHPEMYGSSMHPKVEDIDRDRDRVEISLFEKALERGLPFLGICRGLQLVNIALGGTLFEDIHDQYEGAIPHDHDMTMPRDYLAHKVNIEPQSNLYQIIKSSEITVNSLHHQGIRLLASHLSPSAYAPDGILEAFEMMEYPFGMSVQWHPEWLPDNRESAQLFSAFISACESLSS
jgi:putative glutamine amidotransferase